MLSIELPAIMENLRVFQQEVTQEVRLAGFSSKGLLSLQLVLEEVLTNIFHHAYGDSSSGSVLVAVEAGPDEVHIRIEDHGAPFNLLEVDDPDTTSEMKDRAIGGMGILFIRKISKKLDYIRENGKNIIKITMIDT